MRPRRPLEPLRRTAQAVRGLVVWLLLLLVALGAGSAPVALAQATPTSPAPSAEAPPAIARIGLRVTSGPTANPVVGEVFALDQHGDAVPNLDSAALQATLDGKPVSLSLQPGRPSIALAAGLMLDSSASPQVRAAVANALADVLQGIDVNRDSVAVATTASPDPWDGAGFSTSADVLTAALNRVIRTDPNDGMVSLEQVAGLLKSLSGQPRDNRVLLIVTNRPLASAASANASLGTIRNFAVDNGIGIAIVALSGAGGQGVAEALAEATPGGGVEYALDATNRTDLARHISLLLAPTFGAHGFELAAPAEGAHTLSLGAPGLALVTRASFSVASRAVQIDTLETSAGTLTSSSQITTPIWVQARPTEAAPIDSIEWTLDGRVIQVTSPPWALLLDPEQLGDGQHELAARIISQGRAGPYLSTSIDVPPDFLRTVRGAVRAWGLIALLLVANSVVLFVFVRMPKTQPGASTTTEFPPTLRLNQLLGRYVAPDTITFPRKGKLRVGYHPPYMDNHVGGREFSRLPHQDVRGDEDAVRDLSRHAACIWRDARTNECYIQLGWPGPGEAINPKPQSQVFHFGRPQNATSAPFRLAHHDVVRLGSGVEFVFNQVGLRDKATPESKKLSPFDGRARPATVAVLNEERRRHPTAQETMAEEG